MPYDQHFYRLYEDYLHEPLVRDRHGRAFGFFHDAIEQRTPLLRVDVIDLGCGLGEYRRFGFRPVGRYLGIDKEDTTANVPAARGKETPLVKPQIKADYTDPAFLDRLPFTPNAFISLFSIEACLPVADRYALYHELFVRMPTLRIGMSAGFSYASKRDQETIGENGDIVSYQTIDGPYDHVDPLFEEERLVLRVPSAMFGPDVVEVWKFFFRKS